MTNLPSNVPAADVPYTAACRAIDAAAMAPQSAGGMGLSGDVLMERAAQFALDTLMLLCPNTPAVTIVCEITPGTLLAGLSGAAFGHCCTDHRRGFYT